MNDNETPLFFKQLPTLLALNSTPILANKEHEIRLNPGSNIEKEIFIRSKLILSGLGVDNTEAKIFTLNIQHSHIQLFEINFQGFILLGSSSSIIATNCEFSPYNTEKQPMLFSFANGATGDFINCDFSGGDMSSISCSNGSIVRFDNCTFHDCISSFVTLTENSTAIFTNCR